MLLISADIVFSIYGTATTLYPIYAVSFDFPLVSSRENSAELKKSELFSMRLQI
jgi:hypothetical protein